MGEERDIEPDHPVAKLVSPAGHCPGPMIEQRPATAMARNLTLRLYIASNCKEPPSVGNTAAPAHRSLTPFDAHRRDGAVTITARK